MDDPSLGDYRRDLIARYREQVDEYRAHFSSLSESGLGGPIKPGEWSPHRLLFHVRAVEEQAYAPRIERILGEPRPSLEEFDEAGWMAEHYAADESAMALLDGWSAVRGRIADLLSGVAMEAWNRTGLQPYWGERTLQWWLERAVTHAEDHWRQLHGE